MTEKQVSKLKAKMLEDNSYDTIINEDTDAYSVDKQPLFKFRKKILSEEKLLRACENLEQSIVLTEGRGTASGSNHLRIRNDGTAGKLMVGNKVYASIVGFMDRNAKSQYCRMTVYTKKYFDKFKESWDFVKEVDYWYKELMPDHYKLQREMCDATNRNFVIPDTAFTSVTCNKNFQTAVHQDAGDFTKGFGNLMVVNDGNYHGGYFILPQYKIAIDMKTTDLLLVDVHQWHGNSPMISKIEGKEYKRISFVMYYRENMFQCLSPEKELKRIKMKNNGGLDILNPTI